MNMDEEFDNLQRQQKKLGAVYKGVEGGQYLYHYATRETFWSIIESDLFFARHIRFSNDFAEYKIGEEKIREFLEKKNKSMDLPMEEINHCYMICFCGTNDLLSQWRGYANEGVALGMDFSQGAMIRRNRRYYEKSGITYCSVMNNGEAEKRIGESDEEKKRYAYPEGDMEFTVKAALPCQVQYVDSKKELDEKTNTPLLEKLSSIWDESEEDNRIQQLIQYIPYIKDKNFEEEEEYRIILNLQSLGNSFAHSSAVRSSKVFYMDSDGIKKPTIRVKFGKATDKIEFVKMVYIGNGISKETTERIRSGLKTLYKAEETIKCVRYWDDNNQEDIIIGDGKNQREVFECVETILEAENSEVRIWCDGHLPIRRITVGPSPNQKNMMESIRNYIFDRYWLKYVKVDGSAIPLNLN